MPQPSWIGSSLSGRYQIESLLGQGGMSAVYKATDPNLKRVVAIKLIHPHLSSDSHFIQRFEEEATAVASLRHPNIVQVYDFNSDQGVYYMVLEFVPGETLYEQLERQTEQGRTLPIEAAIKYTLNICDALAYAHQRNIIHRDIKPANIMLDVYGQAILMDFGIVKLIGGTSHTATGAVLGTPRYLPPEAIRSEPTDQRSDIYSLGITLYEMLSGKTPFQSDSAMTLMMMHLNDPVPDPRSLRAEIPVSLVTILLKSLEKDRANRYQSVAEMSADLKRALAEIETGAASGPIPVVQSEATVSPVISPPVSGNVPSREVAQPEPSELLVAQETIYSQPWTRTPPRLGSNPPARKNNTLIWLLGLGSGCLIFVLFLVVSGIYMAFQQPATATLEPSSTVTTVSVPVSATDVLVATSTTAVETSTPLPSETPAPTVEPTATFPPLYVRINGITLDGNQYLVDYETFGFTEKLPGMHIHFFFDTVLPAQAGMPGSGPWILYGGPRPFKGYSVSQRPANAQQMCVLVANSNHSVIAASGNCVDLP